MLLGRTRRQGNVVAMICEQGEVLYVDFEPHVGHEPAKYRPAIVLSADAFNRVSSMTVVAPITSTDNGYPMHSKIDCEDVSGFACVEQMKAVDLNARKCKHVGYAEEQQMNALLSLAGAVFGI